MPKQPPVILLAFANDQAGNTFLRSIAREQTAINRSLQKLEDDNLCKVITLADASANDIFDVFRQYDVRIFHYGGHADGSYLHLASEPGAERTIDAQHFAGYMGQRNSLKLVFLNGCATYQQGNFLRQEGIPYSIITNQKINDHAAQDFATHFYSNLAVGETVPEAFNHASSMGKSQYGGETRSLIWEGKETEEKGTFAWELFKSKHADPNWKITVREVDVIIQEANNLISNGKVKRAIDLLKSYAQEMKHESMDSIVHLSNRLKKLEKDSMLGLISYSDESIQRAQITHSLIEIAKTLREES